MKKTIITSLLFLVCISLAAQTKNGISPQQLPPEVKASFHKDFPTAIGEKWEKEGGNYEANFKVDIVAMSAVYTKNGARKEVEKEIEESKLPHGVLDYIIKNYPGSKLKGASQIVTDKAVVTYEVEITQANKTQGLIFDANGKYKKKESD